VIGLAFNFVSITLTMSMSMRIGSSSSIKRTAHPTTSWPRLPQSRQIENSGKVTHALVKVESQS
jgi:hypothetical protein